MYENPSAVDIVCNAYPILFANILQISLGNLTNKLRSNAENVPRTAECKDHRANQSTISLCETKGEQEICEKASAHAGIYVGLGVGRPR